MQIDNVKRILAEDFDKDHQETVEKLANILNYFMEQVSNAVNGNISFDNLNQRLITVETTVDDNGTPLSGATFASNLKNASGCVVIAAKNVTNGSVYPTSCPFVSFSPASSGTFKINNIKGLQVGNKYRLTIILIGN